MTPMMSIEVFMLLGPADIVALALLGTTWIALGWWIERPSGTRPSVSDIMRAYRHDWMVQMIDRESRIFDQAVVDALRQGTSFFASTCVIAIGGVLALIGNAESLQVAAADLQRGNIPTVVWQVRMAPVALFLTFAFLKFVWSNRLFGYCLIVMAAVPNDPGAALCRTRARQAADLNIAAARTLNGGLRAMYFGLASLAWLLGPLFLVLATLGTGWIVWSREFASRPRDILMGGS